MIGATNTRVNAHTPISSARLTLAILPDMRHQARQAVVDLVIVGAGGFGREVLDVVEAMNSEHRVLNVLGYLDDDLKRDLVLVRGRGLDLLGPISLLKEIDAEYVIGIGCSEVRRRIDDFATKIGRQPATLVHPSATFGADVHLGRGSIICSHVSVTTNVRLGRHVQLHVNCTIGHDVVAGDYVTVLPGATVGGAVTLEEGATVGTNAAIIQGVSVGRMATIGAGAAVIRSVPEGLAFGGVPARNLSRGDMPASQ
jgi:sugar O-acyltransferase (sialic acid O-acetyltransferase NeuD family)